ncbi:MAG: tetratricopeptide repeat protein [Gammaproteobacteria bacterium]|nr:tetratricopeptide repeat protein [Gammaproteobacteria bacterium]MDH5727488.1 tetratricopeptide repeat protein [Gammaproteobacteria bacterium]
MKRYFSLFIVMILTACSSSPTAPNRSQPEMKAAAGMVTTRTETTKKPKTKTERLYQQTIELMKQSDLAKAKQNLLSLTESEPAWVGVWVNLGIIAMRQGDPVSAEAHFKQALARDERNAVAHNYLGMILRQQGQFKKAESAYLNALKYNKNYSYAWRNLGILYDLYLLDYEQAKKTYLRYQQLVGERDQQVAGWLADMERRAQVSN